MKLKFLEKNFSLIANLIRNYTQQTNLISRSDFVESLSSISFQKNILTDENEIIAKFLGGGITKLVFNGTSFSSSSNFNDYQGLAELICPLVEKLNLSYSFKSSVDLISVRFDSLTSISGSLSDSSVKNFLITTSSVCTLSTSSAFATLPNIKFFVPDDLVDTYKINTNWTIYADRIYPLSQSGTLCEEVNFE